MEALADAVGLRVAGFCACVLDVVDGEVELVAVAVGPAAILGPPVGEDAQERAGLRHVAKLLGQVDQSELVSNDFLLCSHDALT